VNAFEAPESLQKKYSWFMLNSVKEIIMYLNGIKKIKINDKWILAEITKKTEDVLKKLDIHIT
jgi:hypothetical protein